MADDLLLVLNELATAAPHDRGVASYSAAEWRAYADGYFAALAFAARGMTEALRRREQRAMCARADARESPRAPDATRQRGEREREASTRVSATPTSQARGDARARRGHARGGAATRAELRVVAADRRARG